MSIQPGWYADGNGQQRYWDGAQWTEHVAGADPAAAAPGQGTVPPGSPAPGAPKKRRVGMWIGIGLGAFVLLCGAGIALFVAFLLNATSGPRDAVNDALNALEAGDCPGFYAYLHEDLTMGMSEAQYCADGGVGMGGETLSHSVKNVAVENNSTATVTVHVTVKTNDSSFTTVWDYHLVKQGDEWVIRDADIAA